MKLEPGAFTFDGKSGLLRVPAERAQELAESLEKAAAGTTVSFEKHPLFVIR